METEMGEAVSQNDESTPQNTISSGAVIGYTGKRGQQRKRVHLGYAMGCVKDDDSSIDWDWKGMSTSPAYPEAIGRKSLSHF